jgi:uncharacterized membrane protein
MGKTTQNQPAGAVEANVYTDVYRVLLVGMFISTAIFLLGVIRALMLRTYFPLTSEWVRQHYHVSYVVRGLATLDPFALMLVASVLLILTPVVRVLVSIYAFWVDHDWKYVGVTSIVLAVMVLTLVLSELGLQ